MLFRGAETVKVDDKGRLKLPTVVRTRLADQYGKNATYFVTSLNGETVLIYPLSEFERIETTLTQAPQFDKTKDKFLFTAYRFGGEATVDEQGRLLIPSKLREAAGVRGELTMFWKGSHIEAYPQAKYEAVADEKKLGPEDFENLGKLGI